MLFAVDGLSTVPANVVWLPSLLLSSSSTTRPVTQLAAIVADVKQTELPSVAVPESPNNPSASAPAVWAKFAEVVTAGGPDIDKKLPVQLPERDGTRVAVKVPAEPSAHPPVTLNVPLPDVPPPLTTAEITCDATVAEVSVALVGLAVPLNGMSVVNE